MSAGLIGLFEILGMWLHGRPIPALVRLQVEAHSGVVLSAEPYAVARLAVERHTEIVTALELV